MKKVIYTILSILPILLVLVIYSCTKASAENLVTSINRNVEKITTYSVSTYGKVNVSKVECEGKTFLVVTAWNGGNGIAVNTIEIK